MTEAERHAQALEAADEALAMTERWEAAALLRAQSAEIEALRSLYRRAINEANGLTNYVEDRPELRSAEKRITKIEQEFRAAIDAARQS